LKLYRRTDRILEIQAHQHVDLFPEGFKIFSFWDCVFKDGKWTGDDIAFC